MRFGGLCRFPRSSSLFARAQSTFTSNEQRDFAEYQLEYDFSLKDPAAYWKAVGEKYLSWDKPFSSSFAGSLAKGDLRYYVGGKLNASYNAVDRHVEKGLGEHRALVWEGDEPSDTREITYNQLAEGVNRFANLLKSLGIGPNDAVVIYMPPCPEAVYAMLGCARIGAVRLLDSFVGSRRFILFVVLLKRFMRSCLLGSVPRLCDQEFSTSKPSWWSQLTR